MYEQVEQQFLGARKHLFGRANEIHIVAAQDDGRRSSSSNEALHKNCYPMTNQPREERHLFSFT